MIEQLYSISNGAQIMGIAEVTLRLKIWQGEIEHIKIGRRIMLRESQIEDYLARNTKPARQKRVVESSTAAINFNQK